MKVAWVLILSLFLPVMIGIGNAKGIGSLEKMNENRRIFRGIFVK
jgi:hypothetical protein